MGGVAAVNKGIVVGVDLLVEIEVAGEGVADEDAVDVDGFTIKGRVDGIVVAVVVEEDAEGSHMLSVGGGGAAVEAAPGPGAVSAGVVNELTDRVESGLSIDGGGTDDHVGAIQIEIAGEIDGEGFGVDQIGGGGGVGAVDG